MHIHARAQAPLALSAAAALLLTACADGSGLGESEALSDIEVNPTSEGEAPEVVIYDDIEAEENSSYVVNEGDGEQVNSDALMDYQLSIVDPSTGEIQQSSHDDPVEPFLALPALAASDFEVEQFFAEGLSAEGVTVGADVAFYLVPDPEQGIAEPAIYLFEVLGQTPAHADGEEQEQSGDLPQIDSEIGAVPELDDHDEDAEAPSELSSEVLIAGEGEEVADDDYVFVQYRGWRWEDGEEFDTSWNTDAEDDGDDAGSAEPGTAGEPFGFSLTGGVIDGWLEGIPGHRVGDRVLLVIPEDQAYGETTNDDGTTEGGQPGGALIFVVDIARTIDNESMEQLQGGQTGQPEQGEAPQLELSDEDRERLEELAAETGMTAEELEGLAMQFGVTSIEELETMFEQLPEDEDENDDAPEADDTDDEDE
ncbi:FKBP-type peptidyl-prolyl cis-trans isomerase [Nesterenkonia sphaerica]|uniref:peptidylprolyl isomerase n=1 Tax=Nesterenkonia sphaerica TaxID=1804988 RepID=A0A5R9A3J1_9MICC|nr:FKBP-type peptidyl-prolyl cis-trans isomerase [Nesterenkonia sphaerica]TLP73192.1 hypothetical protein FEF27_10610 [Nesterenkonia sphaerica]